MNNHFTIKDGIMLIVDKKNKKAWRFRLPEFDYEEALEELNAAYVPRGTIEEPNGE